jgi:glycosyltransferase involved in cell wall biosynthesis
MHSEKPLLSIITVVRNDPVNLAKTLESVKSQSFRDYELVVVDGGSSNETLDVIRKYEAQITTWFTEKDNGIYDAMNKGIRAARGLYIEFLNAGDSYIEPRSLEVVFAGDNQEYDAIYGEIKLFDKNGNFLGQVPALDFTIENLKCFGTGTVNHQAFFVRKSKAPFFANKYSLKAELNWYIDILTRNKGLTFKRLPLAIINYRQGGKGHQHFWKNLYEWTCVVQSKFGFMQNIRNRRTYWMFIKYRYPFLRKINIFQ